MAACSPHAFEPAEPIRGGPGRARCRRCGLTLTRTEARCYAAGYAAGRQDADVDAAAASARSVSRRSVGALLAVLAFAAASALAGLRPEGAAPPPSPSGLDCCGSCVSWAAQLNADIERAWLRCDGSTAIESRRDVRAALSAADRAFGDYAEATYDALYCSESHVPGCEAHMAERLLRARQAAWAAQAAVEKRIYDAQLTPAPADRSVPQPPRRLGAERRP